VPRYIEFREELRKTETHRIQKSGLKRDGVGPNTWDREAREP
jgi:crotonobetaine/carnitine-CoA ligase